MSKMTQATPTRIDAEIEKNILEHIGDKAVYKDWNKVESQLAIQNYLLLRIADSIHMIAAAAHHAKIIK